MKKLFLLLFVLTAAGICSAQTLFTCSNGKATFFSEAPLENIEAFSTRMIAAMNTEKGDVVFRVPIRSFEFEKELMQEHFNENYLESEKYPNATLVAKFVDQADFSKPGRFDVKVKGKLTIHGVTHDRGFEGLVLVNEDGSLNLTCTFIVALEKHDIEIPTVVVKNIAEEIEVKVDCKFTPAKPKG